MSESSKSKLYVFLFLSALVIIAYSNSDKRFSKDTAQKRTHWTEKDNSLLAYSVIEEYVEGRLKSPATANFPGVFDGKAGHITRLAENSYKIISYVDAQNSFGATIRTNFSGKIKQIGEHDWRLIFLQIE